MTWATNVPRGDLLPLNERPRFTGNWNYIQTEMRDNHYWDEDSDKDGRHKRCDMPNLETDGDITVDANGDPDVVPDGTNGIYYVRAKTATEAPDAQNSEPFYAMNDGTRMQFAQLGFRAMVQFEVTGASTITIKYAHNVTSVARNVEGDYTITFSSPLPTNNYIALGTAMRAVNNFGGGSNNLYVSPFRSDTKTDAFSVGSFRFQTQSSQNTNRDPFVVSIAIIGG